MSTRAARGAPARGYRRRKTGLDLDLNTAPPSENRDVEGTSTQVVHNEIQTGPRGRSAPPAMIDVEAIDDDVVESSPRAFAQVRLLSCAFMFHFDNTKWFNVLVTNLIKFVIFNGRPKTIPEGMV